MKNSPEKPYKLKENEFYDSTEISKTQKQKNDIQSKSGNEISININADVPSNLNDKKLKICGLDDNSDSNVKDIKQIENNANKNPNANIENSENNVQNNNINSKEINENQNDNNNLNNNNIIYDFDIEELK